jgi:hypothetical protein
LIAGWISGEHGEACQKAKICKNKSKGKDTQSHIRRRKTAKVSQRKMGKSTSENQDGAVIQKVKDRQKTRL